MITKLASSFKAYVNYRLKSIFGRGQRDKEGVLQPLYKIEVFDVLIRSQLRLQLFDLDEGTEVLLSSKNNDYLLRMQSLFNDEGIEAKES